MSYGIYLVRGESRSEINQDISPEKFPRGGTYCIFNEGHKICEHDLYFNITYNFSWYLYKTIDENDGVRWIYGKKAKDVVLRLEIAKSICETLAKQEEKEGKILSETWGSGERYDPEKVKTDYWYPCAAHAAKAIDGLLSLAKIAPDFTFEGD